METKRDIAILLAVFFSFWAWLYTFGKDVRKFWISLFVNTLLVILSVLIFRLAMNIPGEAAEAGIYSFIGAMVIFIPIWLLIWALAIADAFNKSPQQYASYSIKSKKTGLLLTVLFGPFGYIYTYNKDAIKFWIAIAILVGSFFLVPVILSFYDTAYPTIGAYFKDFFRIPMNLFLDLLFYFLDYYSGTIKPVSFLVPAVLWVGAIASSIIRYLKRDDGIARTSSVPEE